MGKLPRIVIQMDGLDKVQALAAHLSAQLAEIDNTLDELAEAVSAMELRIDEPPEETVG